MNSEIFPEFAKPEKLKALDIRPYSWDEQLTAVCVQGLVNRIEPRIYLIFEDRVDRFWLSVYKERYGIKYEELNDLYELIEIFSDELHGYVVYDDKMLHSANVAMTYGSINEAVAASPQVAEKLSRLGMPKIEEFRGKWKNRLEAYEWALDNLMHECNKRILANCCVDGPYLQPNNKLHHVRDYLVAARVLTFDLSTKIRDRKENELFDRILERISKPGALLGWHCSKEQWEEEYVARAARHGVFVICNLRSPNLSVHAGIKTDFKFKQKHFCEDSIKLEDKVYVCFVHSDGDAMWALNNLYAGNWLDSQRGKFPLTWEIQPLAVHLAPGQMEYYYSTATSNDYLVAGPSGAGYTFLTINKLQTEFIEHTRKYFEMCDIRSALIMNQDLRICFGEIEDEDIPSKLSRYLNKCFGFLHGYFGLPFGMSKYVDKMPYLHTTWYVDGTSNVLREVMEFGERCTSRPLFVSVHVRESTQMASLREVANKLDPNKYKLVNLDEFLLTFQAAIREGKASETFPEVHNLKDFLKRRGRVYWDNFYRRVAWIENVMDLEDEKMLKEFNARGFDFEGYQLPDLLGYEVIETMIYLMRAALLMKGKYVNYINKGVEDFLITFNHLPDVDLMKTIYDLWVNWETSRYDLGFIRSLARRAIKLAKALNVDLLLYRV
jgi:hypothetical protein